MVSPFQAQAVTEQVHDLSGSLYRLVNGTYFKEQPVAVVLLQWCASDAGIGKRTRLYYKTRTAADILLEFK